MAGHYRLDAVRAHLHEMAGNHAAAIAHYRAAAGRTTSIPERNYLATQGGAPRRRAPLTPMDPEARGQRGPSAERADWSALRRTSSVWPVSRARRGLASKRWRTASGAMSTTSVSASATARMSAA